jgi:hypothetical protein
MIGEDLHFMIRCYYKHSNFSDDSIKIVTYSEYMEMGEADDELRLMLIAGLPMEESSHLSHLHSVHRRPVPESGQRNESGALPLLLSQSPGVEDLRSRMTRPRVSFEQSKVIVLVMMSDSDSSDDSSDAGEGKPKKLGAVRNAPVIELNDDSDSESSHTTVLVGK